MKHDLNSIGKHIFNRAALASIQLSDKISLENTISLNKPSAFSSTALEPLHQL